MDMIPQDNAPRKQCKGPCGRMLPATPEFFHRNKKYLLSSCKQCRLAYAKIYNKEHREVIQKQSKQYKENHREIIQEQYKQYRKDNHELVLEREKQYRQNNLKTIYAKAKQARKTEYNRNLRRVYGSRRRARKRNATGTYTLEQMQDQYKRQKGKCYYCGHKVKWGKHHIEHVVPLSRGGSNDISNLVISCATCNFSKNNRLPHEWPQGGRLF